MMKEPRRADVRRLNILRILAAADGLYTTRDIIERLPLEHSEFYGRGLRPGMCDVNANLRQMGDWGPAAPHWVFMAAYEHPCNYWRITDMGRLHLDWAIAQGGVHIRQAAERTRASLEVMWNLPAVEPSR